MEKEYTRMWISEFLGMSERTINYYTERGIVIPEVAEGKGRGKIRKYSIKNIVEIAILKQLNGYGLAFKTVENVFQLLRSPVPPDDLTKDIIKWDERSYIDRWKEFEPNSYIVLYQMMDSGEFKIHMPEGVPLDKVLDKDKIKKSGSVLIINVGRIVDLVKNM